MVDRNSGWSLLNDGLPHSFLSRNCTSSELSGQYHQSSEKHSSIHTIYITSDKGVSEAWVSKLSSRTAPCAQNSIIFYRIYRQWIWQISSTPSPGCLVSSSWWTSCIDWFKQAFCFMHFQDLTPVLLQFQDHLNCPSLPPGSYPHCGHHKVPAMVSALLVSEYSVWRAICFKANSNLLFDHQ